MIPQINSFYLNKKDFVKDFIKLCRWVKAISGSKNTFQHRTISVEGELWMFDIFCKSGKISTQAKLYLDKDCFLKYPETIWGDYGSRWDYELREFLNREVNKN